MQLQSILKFIDNISEWTGRIFVWLIIPLTIVVVYEVISRRIFNAPNIWATEVTNYIYGPHFMLAAAYTLSCDEHVRVDIFYRNASPRRKALVDLVGSLLLLLPVCLFLLWSSLDYAAASWSVTEASRQTGGLPGLFLLKSVIPLTALMLALQGVAMAVRSIAILLGSDTNPGKPDTRKRP